MLNWAKQFNIFCLLDNNGYSYDPAAFECILAAGSKHSISLGSKDGLSALKSFRQQHPGWLFGHFGYELNHDAYGITNDRKAYIDFGPGFFFIPDIIVRLSKEGVSIEAEGDPGKIFKEIDGQQQGVLASVPPKLHLQKSMSRPAYLEAIRHLHDHIHRGDCYEINFCQQFFAEDAQIDPYHTYLKLVETSPNPFSALYKLGSSYCICASPERYLKKGGNVISSQPIKGTSRREPKDPVKDLANLQYLKDSAKERSENVMIVDLVRNDLSRVCLEGSVEVTELFGIYAFPQVYQMISTIIGILPDGVHWTELIKASFPMGSMTGAPKKRVMELIRQYEPVARGLFSGSIGYISPDDDLDFNVVIRSIFYESDQHKLSFQAGSGITFYSEAEKEYEECLLKAAAIREVLNA